MITKLENHILKTLSYFAVFNHPLQDEEVFRFCGLPTDKYAIQSSLLQLVEKKNIFNVHNYYSITDDKILIEDRIQNEKRAKLIFSEAIKMGRIILEYTH